MSLGSSRAPSVLVICVNYHSEEQVQAFMQDLLRQDAAGELGVVIVDNSGGDSPHPRLATVAARDQRIAVLNPGKNLGYYGGAAWGLERYLETASLPRWIIVSNPDIRFPQTDFTSRLCTLYANRAPAVLAPSIRSALAEADQNPHFRSRPSALRMHFHKWVFRWYFPNLAYHALSVTKQTARRSLRRLFATRQPGRPNGQNSEVIYAPHGSFVIYHHSYFDAGGSLRHGAFLYGEEIYVAETVRRLGLVMLYEPRLTVTHLEHSTTGMTRYRKRARYMREASRYLADTFF